MPGRFCTLTVETAQGQGTQAGASEAQLRFATAQGWVVLTTNRGLVVSRHRKFQARGDGHPGILSVPQVDRNRPRFVVRRAFLQHDTIRDVHMG